MGAIKELLGQVQDNLTAQKYAQALDLLRGWGEDAPSQLWEVVEMLALEGEPELPSHFLTWEVRSRRTTPALLRLLADFLDAEETTGLNVALALDLLARDYSVPNN